MTLRGKDLHQLLSNRVFHYQDRSLILAVNPQGSLHSLPILPPPVPLPNICLLGYLVKSWRARTLLPLRVTEVYLGHPHTPVFQLHSGRDRPRPQGAAPANSTRKKISSPLSHHGCRCHSPLKFPLIPPVNIVFIMCPNTFHSLTIC